MQVFFARWPSGRKVKWRSLTWAEFKKFDRQLDYDCLVPSTATYTGQFCLMALLWMAILFTRRRPDSSNGLPDRCWTRIRSTESTRTSSARSI